MSCKSELGGKRLTKEKTTKWMKLYFTTFGASNNLESSDGLESDELSKKFVNQRYLQISSKGTSSLPGKATTKEEKLENKGFVTV